MAKLNCPKCPDFDGFAMCTSQPLSKVASYEWCRKYLEGLEEKVISIVSEVLGIESEKITSADTFDDLYVDSLDLVEIIIECEQEFGYPIKDDKAQNLKTVGDLVNLIKDLDNKDYLESTQADLQVDE